MSLDLSHVVVAAVAGIIGAHIGRIRTERRQQAFGSGAEAEPVPTRLEPGERISVIVFLSMWLTLWSVGILMVISVLFAGESGAGWFLTMWLFLAIIAWVQAVASLIAAFRGERSKFMSRPRC